jgi:hypothetical protein
MYTSLNENNFVGEYNINSGIEFYEGTNPKIFMGYKWKKGKEVAVYKRVKFSGAAYTVPTIQQMTSGISVEGNIFKTGDRIRVTEDKSVWTAFVHEGFQEAMIVGYDQEIIEEPAETLTLECTDSGMKPDMSLSINLLPGQNCYGTVLKIRNLNLDSVDIRQWSRMRITAGYRTGKKATFICPIFASYIEAPNPDGITTFEGITVGQAEDVLNDQYIEIHFVKEEMDLDTLIRGVAPAISSNIRVEISIGDDIVKANEKRTNLIKVKKQTVYAKNGLAVLNWLQSTVSAFVAEITRNDDDTYTSVFMQLIDNTLEVLALNGPNKMPEKVETVVNLDMVTGATFNGTALTVEAPWNPDLEPGGLFYMPPEFIYGSKLPNVLPTEDYRNEDNLYRALTMSVSFASVEGTNKMSVLAIPAQWAGELPRNKTTEMRGDIFARTLSNNMKVTGKPVYVGGDGDVDATDINNVNIAETTNKSMFDEGKGIIAAMGGAGSWTEVSIDVTKGNCLSMLIEYYLFKDPSGPKLVPDTKGTASEAAYYKKYEEFKNYPKAQQYFQTTGCKASIVWWPIVTVGTYWKAQMDSKAGANHNWNTVSLTNPNLIQEGKRLYIPVFTSWSSLESRLKAIKDVWKYAYLEYGELYPNLCRVWRAMYYYLGGTDELN